MPRIDGYIDKIVPRTVLGWAVCHGLQSAPTVELFIDGRLVQTSVANLFRADVRDAGIHPTGWCGFRINLGIRERIAIDSEVDVKIRGFYQSLNNCPLRYKKEKLKANGSHKLLFMHIPKSGGTSVKDFLKHHYRRESSLTDLENIFWQDATIPENYDFLAGHIEILSLIKYMRLTQFIKFTVLRNPIERLASQISWIKAISAGLSEDQIRFAKKQTLSPLQRLSLNLCILDLSDRRTINQLMTDLLDPESWLNRGPCNAKHFNNNGQIRFFLDIPNSRPLCRDHLHAAMQTLRLFDYVLINEQLKDGIKRMVCDLKWTDMPPSPPRLNVMSENFGIDLSDSGTRDILSRAVEIDLEFYEKVSDRIRNPTRDAGR